MKKGLKLPIAHSLQSQSSETGVLMKKGLKLRITLRRTTNACETGVLMKKGLKLIRLPHFRYLSVRPESL